MTMYHMPMPPHMGGPHPPTVHSPLFSSPILPPPMAHNYGMHAFPPTHMAHPSHSSHQSPHVAHQQTLTGHTVASTVASGGTSGGQVCSSNSAMLSHPSPMLSQPSPVYPPQNSVYVNPYIPSQLPHPLAHTHSHPTHQPHQHPSNMGYGMSTGMTSGPPGMISQQQPSGQVVVSGVMPSGPVMSVDEELLEEMNTLHLGFIETDDVPLKMDQREKLERVIMEYLAITPHTHKFMFHQVSDVLEKSINTINDFSAYSAACAFDALAQYATNLIAQPWRKEYREIKLYSGFWVHQVSRHLSGAESVLSLMGYTPKTSRSSESGESTDPACVQLEGVIDPDLISRLALDCLIAYCECQVLKKISEGVREFGLTWRQILQFRQLHVGGIEVTVRHLLFTLRQRLQPHGQVESSPKSVSSSSTGGPPLPVRQSSSSVLATSPVSAPPSQHPPSTSPQVEKSNVDQHSCSIENNVGDQRGSYHHHHHFHHAHHSNGHTTPHPTTTIGANHNPVTASQSPVPQAAAPLSYSRSTDTPDTGKSVSSLGLGIPASQVPTAKLIDLDSSLEALPPPKTSRMIPKTIPHKRNCKSSLGASNRVLPPLDNSEPIPPPPPPPEVFQAGTLEEHLEATLSLVKDPNRNSNSHLGINDQTGSSWETWDFVFRGLEKRGYNKDIGDRGDILHQMSRQNLYSEAVQGKNNNKKEAQKIVKPLSINQALQALAHNETRERVERPSSSSKSSHSLSHSAGPDVFPNLTKRNSLYDNISAGFETAPQDSSDDYEDRRPGVKKVNNAMKIENRLDYTKNNNISSSSSPRSMSMSSKSTHSRPELPSETSRSTTTALTLQQGSVATSTPQSKEMIQISPDNSSFPPWNCPTCTFLNEKNRMTCDMCSKSRTPGPEVTPLISGGRQCPQCTLINERAAQDCLACGVHLEGSSTYI